MGESTYARATLRFDRRLRLEFRGATITSDAGLLACRELDDALGLTETASECLQESRGSRNVQHQLVALLRQSVNSRLTTRGRPSEHLHPYEMGTFMVRPSMAQEMVSSSCRQAKRVLLGLAASN